MPDAGLSHIELFRILQRQFQCLEGMSVVHFQRYQQIVNVCEKADLFVTRDRLHLLKTLNRFLLLRLSYILIVRFPTHMLHILLTLVKQLVAVVGLDIIRPITVLHLRLGPLLISLSCHE